MKPALINQPAIYFIHSFSHQINLNSICFNFMNLHSISVIEWNYWNKIEWLIWLHFMNNPFHSHSGSICFNSFLKLNSRAKTEFSEWINQMTGMEWFTCWICCNQSGFISLINWNQTERIQFISLIIEARLDWCSKWNIITVT